MNGHAMGNSGAVHGSQCAGAHEALLPTRAPPGAHTLSSRPAWFITPADSAATRAVPSRRVGYDRSQVRVQILRRRSEQRVAPRRNGVAALPGVGARSRALLGRYRAPRAAGDKRVAGAHVSQGTGCVAMVPLAGALGRARRRTDA